MGGGHLSVSFGSFMRLTRALCFVLLQVSLVMTASIPFFEVGLCKHILVVWDEVGAEG